MNAVWQHKKEARDAELAKKEAIEKQVAELEGTIQKLEAQLVQEREYAAQLEEAVTKCNNTYTGDKRSTFLLIIANLHALLAYQRAYQANNASLAENAEEGAGKTLAEQLICARKEANDAGTEGEIPHHSKK